MILLFEPVAAIYDYKEKAMRSSERMLLSCHLTPDFLFNETKEGRNGWRKVRREDRKDGEREGRKEGRNLHKP